VYQYKQPFRDGSTHVVLEPLDFIARLAALVPRPRLNLTRFHGVFAPNFKHRARIVPRRPRRIDADKPPAPIKHGVRVKCQSKTVCGARRGHKGAPGGQQH
jgi:hypothetical protein